MTDRGETKKHCTHQIPTQAYKDKVKIGLPRNSNLTNRCRVAYHQNTSKSNHEPSPLAPTKGHGSNTTSSPSGPNKVTRSTHPSGRGCKSYLPRTNRSLALLLPYIPFPRLPASNLAHQTAVYYLLAAQGAKPHHFQHLRW